MYSSDRPYAATGNSLANCGASMYGMDTVLPTEALSSRTHLERGVVIKPCAASKSFLSFAAVGADDLKALKRQKAFLSTKSGTTREGGRYSLTGATGGVARTSSSFCFA